MGYHASKTAAPTETVWFLNAIAYGWRQASPRSADRTGARRFEFPPWSTVRTLSRALQSYRYAVQVSSAARMCAACAPRKGREATVSDGEARFPQALDGEDFGTNASDFVSAMGANQQLSATETFV